MKWPTGALDSIAILDRQSIHPSDAEAATPYLGLEHLDGDGGIDCIQTIGSAGLKSNKLALRRFEYNDSAVNSRPQPYEIKGFRPVARSQDEDDSMAACAGPAFGEGLLDGGNARAPDGTAKAVPAGSRRRSGRVIRETHVRNIKS